MNTKSRSEKNTTSLKVSPSYELNTLIYDMDSETYHKTEGTYSSSQLKDAYADPEVFFKKYIEKSIERMEIDAFGTGTYFHCGVLEPEKLEVECAVYKGTQRRGERWDKFSKEHKGKCIITDNQQKQADKLIALVQNSPVAMGYIGKGKPEVSLFVKLVIVDGEIYGVGTKCNFLMTRNGWEKYPKKIPSGGITLIVKVRADNYAPGHVLDLKSTSGDAKSEYEMMKKISSFGYDLSASFYLDMFTLGTGTLMNKFIWTFASKDRHNCQSYYASANNIMVGRVKWMKAILAIASGIKTDWVFQDSLKVIEPNGYELELIKESETDFL